MPPAGPVGSWHLITYQRSSYANEAPEHRVSTGSPAPDLRGEGTPGLPGGVGAGRQEQCARSPRAGFRVISPEVNKNYSLEELLHIFGSYLNQSIPRQALLPFQSPRTAAGE